MFDIHRSPFKGGDWEEGDVEEYSEGLMQAFAESAEGQAWAEQNGSLGWAFQFIDYGLSYPGSTPAEMTVGDAEEVIFEIFPRKISVDPEAAPEIVSELRAFWQFLQRQYNLRYAPQVLELLGRGAEQRLQRELADPSNYGLAKGFFMTGQKLGFDMTTQEGTEEFMAVYNAAMFGARAMGRASASDSDPLEAEFPAEDPAPAPVPTLSREQLKARDKERKKKLARLKRRKRR